MKNRFKKFGDIQIDDVGQYLRDYLKNYPQDRPQPSIYVGTDSTSKRGKVSYATVIALYDEFRKDGVHYIFKRDREVGKLDVFSRMWREVEKSQEVADFLEVELEGHLRRYTIEDLMVMKNPAGGYWKVNQDKLVTIDVDINPLDGGGKNKSHVAYEAAKSTLTGYGYRCRFKPHSWAANCCADLLCKGIGKKRSGSKRSHRSTSAAA